MNSSSTLYKYRDISERTEAILRTSKIWLATPETLNDPLECQIEDIDPADLRNKSRVAEQSQLAGFIWQAHEAHEKGEDFFGLRGRHINRLLSRIKKTKSFSKKHRMANELLKAAGAPGFSRSDRYEESIRFQMSKVGVFSMSDDASNMLMWSHYGQNHEGIAIGFDATPPAELADPKLCQPVKYSDQPSIVDISKGHLTGVAYHIDESGKFGATGYIPIQDAQVQGALFSKSTDWEYEKEWRYLKPTSGLFDIPGPIVEVVFGLNCSAENRETYKDICKESLGSQVLFREVIKAIGEKRLLLRDA